MKTINDIQELVLDQFRKTNCRPGHIVLMRVFRHSVIPKLNPKEQDLFQNAANGLIDEGYLTYESDSPECLRLTEKGFDRIYADDSTAFSSEQEGSQSTNSTSMTNPFNVLKEAINKVPFVKYALGIAGIGAAIAIIKSFGINNNSIPVISILIMLGFMILLFLFSRLTKSKERPLKVAGYVLVYTTVAITCISSVLLVTSVFFDIPKPINEYSFFQDSTPTDTIPSNVTQPNTESEELIRKNSYVAFQLGEKFAKFYSSIIFSTKGTEEELKANKQDILRAIQDPQGYADHLGLKVDLYELFSNYDKGSSFNNDMYKVISDRISTFHDKKVANVFELTFLSAVCQVISLLSDTPDKQEFFINQYRDYYYPLLSKLVKENNLSQNMISMTSDPEQIGEMCANIRSTLKANLTK